MSTFQFIGLDTHYQTASGDALRRIHMDGAASPLAAKIALDTIRELLPHYSNTHSYVHSSAQISTKALTWAHQQVLDFVAADQSEYTSIFMGAGTTAAINRIARGMAAARPERKVVLVSAMEHHANDLPHRQFDNQVHYIPLQGNGAQQGQIDLVELELLLKQYQGQVNYIALSWVSNVTGIVNPVKEITELAHKYDALIVVDGAQAVAHRSIALSSNTLQTTESKIDFLIFSGHKLYCPTAPGVLVAKRELLHSLSGQDLGGGSVSDVSYYDYQLLSEFPEKEQSGTPNIVGAIALARVMRGLKAVGADNIEQHSISICKELQQALESLANIEVYGDPKLNRLGAISFNHCHIDHGLLAAVLNDFYAIAVRNECFCAHPYVSSMLKESLWDIDLSEVDESQHEMAINQKRGMVRASASLYTTSEDIEALVKALLEIEKRIDSLEGLYEPQQDGSYRHKTFKVDWRKELGWN